MTVGTNLETVYFKKHGQVLGNSAPFAFHKDFTGITVKPMTSYGNLNPDEVPLLILNGFEYVTQWGSDPYSIPLRADTSKPKLTQQDVTDLIAYLNRFGNLFCIGRNGQHRYNNMDHSMATAFEAVDNICAGKTDKKNVWNVNTEKEYHEEKKES